MLRQSLSIKAKPAHRYLVSSDVLRSGRDEDDVSVEGALPEHLASELVVQVEGSPVLQPAVLHRLEG